MTRPSRSDSRCSLPVLSMSASGSARGPAAGGTFFPLDPVQREARIFHEFLVEAHQRSKLVRRDAVKQNVVDTADEGEGSEKPDPALPRERDQNAALVLRIGVLAHIALGDELAHFSGDMRAGHFEKISERADRDA